MAAWPDPDSRPLGVVLVGGASRRMGRDKATLELDGRPLGSHAVDALAGAGLRVVLLGGTRHHEQTLRRPCWPDRRPGYGPLVSLWGLLADVGRDVVALPCDLPEVTSEHVRALVHGGAPKLARVGCIDGRPAYPIGWWSSAIIPTLATATNNGIRSFREALAGVSAGLDSVDLVGIDDVDDPDQLRRLGYPPPHD